MKKSYVFSVCVIVVGIVLLGVWRSLHVRDEYGFQAIEIVAGDETHPGFQAVFFSLQKEDLVHVVSTVTSPVLFVVVANATYWGWRNQYYSQGTPFDLVDDCPNYGNGTLTRMSHHMKIEQDENSFAAPADGEYVWVFLNERDYSVHVTYSASLIHTRLWSHAAFALYVGIASCLMGTAILAFFMRTDIGLRH